MKSRDIVDGSDEISIKELMVNIQYWMLYIKSKWVSVVVLGSIGAIAGIVYAQIKKPVYIATTTFVLESGDSGTGPLGTYAGLASMVGIDLGGGGGGIFQGDNILELYKSRMMIQKTLLTKLDYDSTKIIFDRFLEVSHLKDNLKPTEIKSIDSSGRRSARLKDSIFGKATEEILERNLFVSKPDKKLSIIRVDVKSEDDIFAETFNNELVKNVNEFFVATKLKKTSQNVNILQRKTDSVRAVMNGAIFSAVLAGDETPNLNPTKLVKRAVPVQKAQFTAETNKAVLTELVKNLELTKITMLKETPLIQVIDQPILPLKAQRITVVKSSVLGAFIFVVATLFFLSIKRLFSRS